jgi:predicted O-linked N-acetylglucosamine transferase (SPINDLY family)
MSEPVVSDPASPLDAAVKLHQAGKVDRAAKAYREILEQQPNHSNALHLLGVTELQLGHFAEAVDLISRAIAAQPNTGVYHVNLAAALRAVGRIDDAIEHAERAIVLDPALVAQGYHVAALAFADGGQPQEAFDCWHKALEARPDFAEASLSIAMMADRLGHAYHAISQQEIAVRLGKAVVDREPENAPGRLMLGRALEFGGDLEAAIAEYRVATRLLPHDATVFLALGKALIKRGQHEEAMTALRFAVRMNPRLGDAQAVLGSLLLSQGRASDAVDALRTALSLQPNHPEARSKLADALAAIGEVEQAVAEARAAADAQPASPSAHSTLLRTLLLDGRVTPQQLFDAHVEWDRRHGRSMARVMAEHAKWEQQSGIRPGGENAAKLDTSPDPDRPIRVGLVSPHLHGSPLAKLLVPLLDGMDRAQFHVIAYSDSPVDDSVAAHIKRRCAGWRETYALTDLRLSLLIREDLIDILVDLTGHGDGGRMTTFAQKPAPVQVTTLGYRFTTGITSIDWRLTDEIADPPGGDAMYVEEVYRLPAGRPPFAFRPWENTPTRLENRSPREPVVFGCVSDVACISPPTIAAWSQLLRRVPDARLLVMCSTRDDERLRQRLVAGGIDSARLVVVPREEGRAYLDFFNRIDVALDTFPSSGGTTAGDCLWMARPMVTCATALPASRTAAVLLEGVGLGDLIADSPEAYVDVAAKLASDRERLTSLAGTLRETLAKSPPCNPLAAAAAVGQFYRDAWRRYCQSRS